MSGERDVSIIVRVRDATVSGLRSARDAIGSWASSVQGQITGALAGISIGMFAKRAIDEVSGAERAFSQLDNSLANIGVDFQRVKPDIDAAIGSLQKVAAIDDDDAVASLNRLVQLSGNYKESLKNLPLVADVAAAKNIDLADAAERVGKIMAGTGGKALKDFGITTKDTAQAIEELRAKVKGAAETELHTLGGSLKAANIAYGDVAQAVGEVVAQSPGFQKFTKDGIAGLRGMADWLTQHKAMLQSWLAVLFAGVKEAWTLLDHLVGAAVNAAMATNAAGNYIANLFNSDKRQEAKRELDAALSNLNQELSYDLVAAYHRVVDAADTADAAQTGAAKHTRSELEKNKAAQEAALAAEAATAAATRQAALDKAKDERIAQMEKAGALKQYRGQMILALKDLESETEFFLKGNQSLAQRLLLMDRLAKIQGALTKLHADDNRPQSLEEFADRRAGPRGPVVDTSHDEADVEQTIRNVKVDTSTGPDLDFGQRLGLSLEDSVGKGTGALESLGKTFADLTAGPILGFGDAIMASMDALVSGSGNAGKAFLGAMGNAIKGVAAMKGKLFAGEAIGALAAGFLGHPGAFAAAAKFGAAAALMFTLAGAAGGIGGGGGGGGGGSPQQAAQSTQSALSSVDAGQVNVVLKGKKLVVDADDPDEQDGFIAMIKKITGNRQVSFTIDESGE